MPQGKKSNYVLYSCTRVKNEWESLYTIITWPETKENNENITSRDRVTLNSHILLKRDYLLRVNVHLIQ